MRKLGRPPREWLRRLARAAHLSAAAPSAAPGPLLEPLAALHGARLKLLDSLRPGTAASSDSGAGVTRLGRPALLSCSRSGDYRARLIVSSLVSCCSKAIMQREA